ncbi:MAG TPA: hypothetical protein VF463_13930 [Sphingobium sp.]
MDGCGVSPVHIVMLAQGRAGTRPGHAALSFDPWVVRQWTQPSLE